MGFNSGFKGLKKEYSIPQLPSHPHVFMVSFTFFLPVTHSLAMRFKLQLKVKVKVMVNVKFTVEQATKAQRVSRGIALHFL